MSEIWILNLCHKKSILVDIYRQSLLKTVAADFGLVSQGILENINS